MASLREHNQDGYDAFVRAFKRVPDAKEIAIIDEINRRMDQFAHYPDMEFLEKHRQFLHHEEGIEYFERLYGDFGSVIATAHVMLDCGHVPEMMDYWNGKVDCFGRKREGKRGFA